MKKNIKITIKISIGLFFLVILLLYFQTPFSKSSESSLLKDISIDSLQGEMEAKQLAFLDESLIIDDTLPPSQYDNLYNPEVLIPFFQKLSALDSLKDRKINILHIGDSHVQADIMTHILRQRFQQQFGNAGLGFVFPYSIIRTNGGQNVRFSSNIMWDSQKNTEVKNSNSIGLSGYSFTTKNKNFVIELDLRNKEYAFNTLKIITPNNQRFFDLATNNGEIKLKPTQPKNISHKVKKGETLYGISRKYNTTVNKIQQSNKLKGTNIRIGATLIIPTSEIVSKQVDLTNFNVLNNVNSLFSYYTYENLEITDRIFLTPNPQSSEFSLNGIVLENNQNGIIYHSIGVNGAHFSDYNQSALFFEQIKALDPDLIIVSLGTNESFSKLSSLEFQQRVDTFINSIRNNYGYCPLLLTSPPPSLFKRKNFNPFPLQYANTLIDKSVQNQYSVFDLYNALGGHEAMNRFISKNLIANDRIHYSASGYQEHGSLIFDALIGYYFRLKNNLKTSHQLSVR